MQREHVETVPDRGRRRSRHERSPDSAVWPPSRDSAGGRAPLPHSARLQQTLHGNRSVRRRNRGVTAPGPLSCVWCASMLPVRESGWWPMPKTWGASARPWPRSPRSWPSSSMMWVNTGRYTSTGCYETTYIKKMYLSALLACQKSLSQFLPSFPPKPAVPFSSPRSPASWRWVLLSDCCPQRTGLWCPERAFVLFQRLCVATLTWVASASHRSTGTKTMTSSHF